METSAKLFFAVSLAAQITTAGPARAGVTNPIETQSIDHLLAPFDRPDAPGLCVGVFRAGEIIYSRAVGMADLKRGLPLTTNSVFDIASMSKQFTAFAVVLLQADGRLSLDDDVGKYLPEIHTGGKKMTIRQLLQHTSGIRDYLDLMQLEGTFPDLSMVHQGDVSTIILHVQTLNFNPGDAFRYENTGYALLATLVQRVSGMSLREFAAARIFGPLGMKTTLFRDNHYVPIAGRTCGYEPQAAGWNEVNPIYDAVGDGGVWTTLGDLAKWDGNFYQPRVGGTNGVELLYSQAVLNNGLKMAYALGLFVEDYHGLKMVSHGGVDPGYRAQMLRFPAQKLTVAVLANNPAFDVEGLARQIADIFLPRPAKPIVPEAAPRPIASLTQYSGKYLEESTGRVREIVVGKDGLILRSHGRDFPLTTIEGDLFQDPQDGSLLRFTGTSSNCWQMTMTLDGWMPAVCRQLPANPPPVHARDYQGPYTNVELAIGWFVWSKGTNVLLVRTGGEEILSPLNKDIFSASPGLISFVRTNTGRIVSFKLTNVRDYGIEFRRAPD
jgi:CubicO group peptidase (beta-lactamase class C family)